MNRFLLRFALLLLCLSAVSAQAHIGSPDVFFEGKIGPYPARVTIRMPAVIPGRAEIEVFSTSGRPLEFSFLPLYSKIPVKNSPPPDTALPALGEPGLYRGELWLMRAGGYSIEVNARGDDGEGSVQIPVNSVATHQLPMPRVLVAILSGLGGLLLAGGLAIVKVAVSESTLPAGAVLDRSHRKKGIAAMVITALLGAGSLAGGRMWWNAEEASFRRHLREGAWPDLVAEVRTEGSQRILRLTLGEKAFAPHYVIPLLPDHGKLLHVFLIGDSNAGMVAHVHPIRQGGKVFEVVLPPLAEGDYRVFVDLTMGDTEMSATTTASIHLRPIPASASASGGGDGADADDSWAACPAASVPKSTDPFPAYHFADGLQILWKPHPPLRARHDAGLQFEVRDSEGKPVALEPYMGMVSHAAVMRADGAVFAHLHPAGNFSMAAQMYFESKIAAEAAGNAAPAVEMDHARMHHGGATPPETSAFYLPYEFPSPGNYDIWVQFKTAGRVHTARFVAPVAP